MSTKQNAVSLQIPLKPDKVAEVTELLNTGGNPALKQTFFSFKKMPTVHFARWIVVPAGKGIDPSLVYAGNIDGDKQQHLKDLVDHLGDDLDQIFKYCQGYPDGGDTDTGNRLAFLKKHAIPTQGFYVGAPNRTVQQIHQEGELYDALRTFVKDNGSQWKNSKEAYTAIKGFVGSDPKWDWARKPYHTPKVNILATAFLALLLLVLLPVLIIFIILIHFFYELRAKPFGKTQSQIPLEHLAALKDQEDIIYQNQLSQVFELKGGLRKLGLKFFLWATSWGARNTFVMGQLMGTPTIHFARWVIIDGGKRFVFFSNFDGSFDEYLGDFVDNNGWGLNAIYGAAKGYPRTFFMFGRGSYRIAEFMGWGRLTQVPTPIWYSAYPWDGLQQIVDRSKLRMELFNSGELNDAQIKQMLRRI
ncbi:hypothetical protein POV27_14475 [Aureisphaera galaxeae]|uniref:hypothetical protein n=1 Tax=Aureisphaera galaxeae TaxID=1538023 RepID=UPI00234FEF43|nr:hypothetical protein [Aureisphaera galaxeae]MDC8005264.1 hypothetical protein [Aureisphaera galaxeae]